MKKRGFLLASLATLILCGIFTYLFEWKYMPIALMLVFTLLVVIFTYLPHSTFDKDANLFNNFLFPIVISFTVSFMGFTLSLRNQANQKFNDDRKKEKQYLNSLRIDLENDFREIDHVLLDIGRTIKGLDSALEQMQKPMNDIDSIKLNYISIMKYDWYPPKLNFNQGTITQLKHVGGLNLITIPQIFDSIGVYDVGISLCEKDASIVIDSYKETFSTQKYVYNYRDRLALQHKMKVYHSYELQKFSNEYLMKQMSDSVKMVTTDKLKIIACYNDFANYKASLELQSSSLTRQKQITQNLINLIKGNK